jgi:hypothetical protein
VENKNTLLKHEEEKRIFLLNGDISFKEDETKFLERLMKNMITDRKLQQSELICILDECAKYSEVDCIKQVEKRCVHSENKCKFIC